jgi:hypothetical protein
MTGGGEFLTIFSVRAPRPDVSRSVLLLETEERTSWGREQGWRNYLYKAYSGTAFYNLLELRWLVAALLSRSGLNRTPVHVVEKMLLAQVFPRVPQVSPVNVIVSVFRTYI